MEPNIVTEDVFSKRVCCANTKFNRSGVLFCDVREMVIYVYKR